MQLAHANTHSWWTCSLSSLGVVACALWRPYKFFDILLLPTMFLVALPFRIDWRQLFWIGGGAALVASGAWLCKEVRALRASLHALDGRVGFDLDSGAKVGAARADAALAAGLERLSRDLRGELDVMSRHLGARMAAVDDAKAGLARCRQLALRLETEVEDLRARAIRSEDASDLRLAQLREQLRAAHTNHVRLEMTVHSCFQDVARDNLSIIDGLEQMGLGKRCFGVWARLVASTRSARYSGERIRKLEDEVGSLNARTAKLVEPTEAGLDVAEEDLVQLQYAVTEQGDELAETRRFLDVLAEEVRGGGLAAVPVIDTVRSEISRRLSEFDVIHHRLRALEQRAVSSHPAPRAASLEDLLDNDKACEILDERFRTFLDDHGSSFHDLVDEMEEDAIARIRRAVGRARDGSDSISDFGGFAYEDFDEEAHGLPAKGASSSCVAPGSSSQDVDAALGPHAVASAASPADRVCRRERRKMRRQPAPASNDIETNLLIEALDDVGGTSHLEWMRLQAERDGSQF